MARRDDKRSTRRGALKKFGALGATAALGALAPGETARSEDAPSRTSARDGLLAELESRVAATPMVDTHEHLPDEEERLRGDFIACDDWGLLFSHYIDSDLASAGMPGEALDRLTARGKDPVEKWRLLAPYWPFVKNTGYGRVVRIALKDLYGIDELDEKAAGRLQAGYESVRKPGFYRKILVGLAGIESCQVNYLWRPFKESRDPTLLTQDISILGMHSGPDVGGVAGALGMEAKDLGGFHGAIDAWFEKYAPYAVAVKCQAAYSRGLDYERVPAERAEPVFRKIAGGEQPGLDERRLLDDHLFWYCVDRATERGLPVKLHTGYYAGHNGMPLSRVGGNPAQASDLCRKSPATNFVFMHIAYPYWQDLIAVAKHYTNAHIDMCWAWIIDPAGSKEFLKSYLAAAPANKVLVFGGDYIPVECVLGHARMARRGVARALRELVEDGWLEERDALGLVEPLLRGNARRIFRLEDKLARLAKAPWL